MPMKAATPNTAASIAMILMVDIVLVRMDSAGEDRSSRTSPNTKFIPEKERPTNA